MLDLAITGGMVVDGTGAPPRRADVGVRDGRIAAIGDLDESARETRDADGLALALERRCYVKEGGTHRCCTGH